ncbi:RDD family protein [Flavihumibacter sp. CACIAM 22H1]|uniref:RDD family protein n=1 Tax=Flavihumibacter sp. CACIAM 22H1 TaxID=1812911 RepID=UPI0007A85654|nr:RDD family protein [Flavihumibacter sp. CACIAM 22H1]KYP15028.1 MAG: hypothetical protein A1D16_01155 [Flavihumibacter sp. CACIAM 22H1]
MPVTKLHTGFNIEVDFTLSAFHKRLLAWIIDLIVLFVYLWICSKILRAINQDSVYYTYGLLDFILWLPVLGYFLLCEILTNGQSPGKRIMRIRVITASGGQPTISQYLIRWMFRSIDFPTWLFFALVYSYWPWYFFPFLFIGLICFIATPDSQRVGDLLAGTIVIDTNTESTWQQTVFMEVEEAYQPAFPAVMGLSDRDMNTIKQVLLYARKKPNTPVLNQVAVKIQTALKIETDLDAAEFLEILLKDYNFLSRR